MILPREKELFYGARVIGWHELKSIGVKVFSAYENLEITDDLISRIIGSVSEHYITNLSMETAKGKHQVAHMGYLNCSRTPLGYRKWRHGDSSDLDRRIMIVDPPAAEAVRTIFEMYSTGLYSFSDLAQYLNDKSFITCTGRSFAKDTIRTMIENVAYISCVIYNNSIEENLEVYPEKHKAIISLELFSQV